MPRYDDQYGNTRLYVGRLSSRTRSRELEHIFSKYGRVRDVDMKHDYAFVDFSDPRDADDARYSLNGREFHGHRLIVEFARGIPRGPGGSRDYMSRGPPPGSGRCFNCGLEGHWARDCKAGDWKNKCYRCGERGHVERNCHNSPKKLSRRERSYSRSPVRSSSPRHGRRRSRSSGRSFSRSHSYSRSRSPPKRERMTEHKSRSRSYSRSPDPENYPQSMKARKCSPTPEDDSPIERASLSRKRADGSDNGESPRARSSSPIYSPQVITSAEDHHESGSPSATRSDGPLEANGEANGLSRSPSPEEKSPLDDDNYKNNSP